MSKLKTGLSPRVRGNRRPTSVAKWVRGSIPACAGEPGTMMVRCSGDEVYPRVCGGTARSNRAMSSVHGLSPRVRGNQHLAQGCGHRVGSIPACAGEPPRCPGPRRCPPVYPRVCGGTASSQPMELATLGLSPRVRGNQPSRQGRQGQGRSIPACAGEPSCAGIGPPPPRVYPRVCGGTAREWYVSLNGGGLSPRVRGNHLVGGLAVLLARSIPACAGEPPMRCCFRWDGLVYPRVCGGTNEQLDQPRNPQGLSPRVRGNRPVRPAPRPPVRSIPACAGEPWPMVLSPCVGRVYPRVCGGTGSGCGCSIVTRGLSPRVRGNRPFLAMQRPPQRSIPACAGEPKARIDIVEQVEVYPRVCGGTGHKGTSGVLCDGLSPRVRGNQVSDEDSSVGVGSIPACAGEPTHDGLRDAVKKVYPRVCGGTPRSVPNSASNRGLSPRVRGNHAATR